VAPNAVLLVKYTKPRRKIAGDSFEVSQEGQQVVKKRDTKGKVTQMAMVVDKLLTGKISKFSVDRLHIELRINVTAGCNIGMRSHK
jgi:hypothetical protein